MKRKFKLFATVASLCLCFALMAFGVYAAANVTYKATGTVSFEVSNVFVKAETAVYKAKDAAGKKVADPASQAYDDTAYKTTDTRSSLVDNNWADLAPYEVGELKFNEAGSFKIVVTLTNLSEQKDITVTSHAPTGTQLVNATITEDSANASVSNIEKGNKTVTLTYYVALTDVAKVSSGSWTIIIELNQAA